MPKQINKTFKILSFFAIYFVVSGHLPHGGVSLVYDWFTPYSFHVPLFLFISGYFYKDSSIEKPLAYIWKKFKKLMIPMYAWNLFYGLLTTLLYKQTNIMMTYWEPISFKSLFLMPLYNGHQFSLNLATWFVFPLFCVEVANVLFRKISSFIKLNNEYFFTLIYLIIGIYGIKLSYQNNSGWWLALERFMFLLPAYQFGTLYSKKLEKHDKAANILYFGVIFTVQLAVSIYCGTATHIYLASWMSDFGHGPIVPYITIVTGIAFWLRISKLLTPSLENSKTVLYVADNTFSIMTHHLLGFYLLNTILWNIMRFTGIIKEFNVYASFNNAMYMWYPPNLKIFSIVYVVFGFAVSLGIAYIIGKFKLLINKRIA